jgi:hypothetical protein
MGEENLARHSISIQVSPVGETYKNKNQNKLA